jgi:hypothetical protein
VSGRHGCQSGGCAEQARYSLVHVSSKRLWTF